MEKYAFLKYSDYDKVYYDKLYATACQGGQFEGKLAVDFLKLSEITPAYLREVWNLSSVFKQRHLSKEEFFLAMKYVTLAQQGHPLTIESLIKYSGQLTNGPRLQGIEMPLIQKPQSSNPFDAFFGNEEQEEGFDDFQEAPQVLVKSNIPSQPTPTLITNPLPNMPTITNLIDQMGALTNFTVSQPNNTQTNNDKSDLLIDFNPSSQTIDEPKNYEDMLFNQLKNAKFVYPQASKPAETNDTPIEQNSWAQFSVPTGLKAEPAKADRFDLIHDAFAELLTPSSTITAYVAPQPLIQTEEQKGVEDEDGFEEYVSADPTPTVPKEVDSGAIQNFGSDLLGFETGPSLIFTAPPIVSQSPLLQVHPSIFNTTQSHQNDDPFKELTDAKPQEAIVEEEGFDEFQEAGQVSSIPEVNDSRQDSNIFSNSKHDIENNSFNSQDNNINTVVGGPKNFIPEGNWLSTIDQNHPDQQNVEEDFGDWTDAQDGRAYTEEIKVEITKGIEANDSADPPQKLQSEDRGVNLLLLDENDNSSEKQEIQKAEPIQFKPRVELNENNLLSGFMLEFGLQSSPVQPTLPVETEHDKVQSQLLDLNFESDSKEQKKPLKIKQSECRFESKHVLHEQLKERIQRLTSRQGSLSISTDYSTLDNAELEKLIQSKEKLQDFRVYLSSRYEMPECQLQSTIDNHNLLRIIQLLILRFIRLLQKIDKKNKKKAEAAVNEEFELAVKYKKQVVALQGQLMQVKDVKEILKQKPELTTLQLLELVLEIDKRANFTRNLISNLEGNMIILEKEAIISYLLVFLKQNEKGMTKVRDEIQDIVNVLNQEILVVDGVVSDLQEEIDSDETSMVQLMEDSKFKRFIQGLFVMLRILELQQLNATVAEMQEDDDLSIEIEALKMEAETCKEQLSEKIGVLMSLTPEMPQLMDSFSSKFHSLQPISYTDLDNISTLLKGIKSDKIRKQIIEEDICNFCCNSLQLKDIQSSSGQVTYSGNKYHSFCINFWLNKVNVQQ